MRMYLKTMKTLTVVLFCLLFFTGAGSASAQSDPVVRACDLQTSVQKLAVTGTVMYIAAHPDDENTALLAYFSKGKKYRTVYLSLTRGEGGQNILGTEKGADLGVIRTQELLAARRVDGAEQMFTRAIDFGFSKTSDETIAMWTKDSVVADIVWAIRTVRPDIIITRFSPTEGGHGNHTASAILAEAAYKISGDPSAYPEQLRFVRPWKAKILFFNRLNFGIRVTVKDPDDLEIDTGIFDPLLGLSYTEVAGISRSLHKTQGMGSAQRRGANPEYFRLTDQTLEAGTTDRAAAHGTRNSAALDTGTRVRRSGTDLFAGIDASWNRFSGGASIDRLLRQAGTDFEPAHPEKIAGLLLKALKKVKLLANENPRTLDPMILRKQKELVAVLSAALGIRCDIVSSSSAVLPGHILQCDAEIIQRSGPQITLRSISAPMLGIDTSFCDTLHINSTKKISLAASIPASMRATAPYWLQRPAAGNLYRVPSQEFCGLPENPDSLTAAVSVMISGESMTLTVPVRFRRIDPVAGEVFRPVVILPRLDVSTTQNDLLWTGPGRKQVSVHLVSNDSPLSGRLTLNTPSGFRMASAPVSFAMARVGEEQNFVLTVEADSTAAAGTITPVATVSGSTSTAAALTTAGSSAASSSASPVLEQWTQHGADISYPHIVPQFVMHTAQLKAMRADIRVTKSKIGVIAGTGDEVPAALRLCGYDVVMIDDDSLRSGILTPFDAIVVGVRAYNVRTQVQQSNPRLLEYVQGGGTLVVQYQTPGKEVESIGPYPFRISRNRVTDEHAEMSVAVPPAAAHDQTSTQGAGMLSAGPASAATLTLRLMTVPNRLKNDDFNGWVQERGLYFADKWDPLYETPFSCHDPNEPPTQGSVLAAPYGRGVYCYTGLAFFRQLPEAVPGAFRLFINLLELKQAR